MKKSTTERLRAKLQAKNAAANTAKLKESFATAQDAFEREDYEQALAQFEIAKQCILDLGAQPSTFKNQSAFRDFVVNTFTGLTRCYQFTGHQQQSFQTIIEAMDHGVTEQIAEFALFFHSHGDVTSTMKILLAAESHQMLTADTSHLMQSLQSIHDQKKLLRLANSGNPYSYLHLGIDWLYNNNQLARVYFQKAAEMGSIEAHNQLHILYMMQDSEWFDLDKAMHHVKISVKNGNVGAFHNLACMYDIYFNKKSKAVYWYQQAIKYGQNVHSMHNLAMMYEQGDGVPKNTLKAYELYRRAVQGGKKTSRTNLASIILDPTNEVPTDPIYAKKLLRAAVDDGEQDYAFNLLACHIYFKNVPSKNNIAESFELFLAGAQRGDINATYNFAANTITHKPEELHTTAAFWYEQAVKRKFAKAFNNYAIHLADKVVNDKCSAEEKIPLIKKVIGLVQSMAECDDEVLASLANSLLQKPLENTDQQLRLMRELAQLEPEKPVGIQSEIEQIANRKKASAHKRFTEILQFFRNINWSKKEDIAYALYHIGKIFDHNSQNRKPFEEHRAKIERLIQFVIDHHAEFTSEEIANVFIGLSKMHLHPDYPLMQRCLETVLPKMQEHLEQIFLLNKRKVLFSASRFLPVARNPAAVSFCKKLLEWVAQPNAMTQMDHVLATEFAYFLGIYHACRPDTKNIKTLIEKIAVQTMMITKAKFADPRFCHQWLMIAIYYQHTFGQPLKIVEQKLRQRWQDLQPETSNSFFEEQVATTLQQLGIKYEREKVFNGIPGDFYLPEFDLLLEANGPSHYLYNHETRTYTPTPRDIARSKIVAQKVAPLSYVQWQKWQDAHSCKRELQQFIVTHGKQKDVVDNPKRPVRIK